MRAEPTALNWLAPQPDVRSIAAAGGLVQSFRAGMTLVVGDDAEVDSAFNVTRVGTTPGASPIGTVVGGRSTFMAACDQPGDVGTVAATAGHAVLVCIFGFGYSGTSPGTAAKRLISPSTQVPPYLAASKTWNVMDLGAVGSGLVSDSAAIQLAFSRVEAAGRGRVLIPPGDYLFTSPVEGTSNVLVDVMPGATIRATSKIQQYLRFNGHTNIKIRGLGFDLAQPSLPMFTEAEMPGYSNVALDFFQCSNILVEDCDFTDLYTWGMFFYQCSGKVDLIRNKHYSLAQPQASKAEHIAVQTCAIDLTVDNCLFSNAAPASAGYGVAALYQQGTGEGRTTFSNNVTHFCGRDYTVGTHQLGAFSVYGDSKYVRVFKNQFYNSLERVVRLSVTHFAEVDGNFMHMSSLAQAESIVSIEGTASFWPAGLAGCRDIKVHHNTFMDLSTIQRGGVRIASYDWGCPSQDIQVTQNNFIGMKFVAEVYGPFRGVRINDNQIRNVGPLAGLILVNWEPPGAGVGALMGVAEAAGLYESLQINRNEWDLDSSTGNVIWLNIDKTPAAALLATIGDLDVCDNYIKNHGTGNVSSAVVVRGTIGKGRYTASRNKLAGFIYGIDYARCGEISLSRNQTRSMSGDGLLDSGSNGLVYKEGNDFAGGPMFGRATLGTGGTATVATDEVRSTDNIRLTRLDAAGTIGHLTAPVGAIVNAVSFQITSSDAADRSTIFWEIVH